MFPVCLLQCLIHLMSWSMLHSGDISSKVFENFTTYEKKERHPSPQLSAATRQVISKKQKPAKVPWGPDRRVDVLQEQHGAAFTLQQGQRSLHDLPHDLLQVSLLLKQVVDHLKQSLWPHKGH